MADSLSPVQVSQLKKSWSVLAQDPDQLASTLVMKMFNEKPEYQSLFKRLKNLPLEELPSNPQFKAHAAKVGSALGATIDHLDKPKELNELLVDLGVKHKKYGLKPEHFEVIGNLLVGMIADAIGESDPELLGLWKSSLTAVMAVLINSCCA